MGKLPAYFARPPGAEEIHASNHAVVIHKLGAEPKATIEMPVVASTRENLQVAILGETYERDQMNFLRCLVCGVTKDKYTAIT